MPEMTAVSPSGATTDSLGLTSADDLEGLEMTLEILRDGAAAERISRSLAALGRGDRSVQIATVRADLARAISKRLPAAAAAEVIQFCDSALALNPRQVGRPLFGPLAGCHGVRRGTFQIVYRINEETMMVEVLDIDHRGYPGAVVARPVPGESATLAS
jgi:mRNA-degrading endonuclease RelE of RelBE toxin-antitoxin system